MGLTPSTQALVDAAIRGMLAEEQNGLTVIGDQGDIRRLLDMTGSPSRITGL